MNKKIEKAINKQLNAELYSGYLYYSMSAYFESINLPGCATWMRVQATEELAHVEKFFRFIVDRGGRVTLAAVEAPRTEWESPLAAFKAAYEHEQKVTGLINDLFNLAIDEKDSAARVFLQWFVTEQVEEEASVDKIVQKIKLGGESGPGLLIIDQQLGERSASEGETE